MEDLGDNGGIGAFGRKGQCFHARTLSCLDYLNLFYEVLPLIPLPCYPKTVSVHP